MVQWTEIWNTVGIKENILHSDLHIMNLICWKDVQEANENLD